MNSPAPQILLEIALQREAQCCDTLRTIVPPLVFSPLFEALALRQDFQTYGGNRVSRVFVPMDLYRRTSGAENRRPHYL